MVAGSILPVSIHNNKLYFLFGKENSLEDSAKGWSDFGGGVEKGETPYSTAMREGGEELTGFLGDGKNIKKLIKKNGGIYKIQHNTYHAHLFFLEYDENLPKYYNQNHRFLWERMDKQLLSKTKLFEKIEIGWFSIEDMKTRRSEFRGFYQEIIDKFIADKENILRFIHKKNSKKNNTLKLKSTIQHSNVMENDNIVYKS
jgi:8-oxo-dGTP pyrophosphatase MutT (NUDIX family)